MPAKCPPRDRRLTGCGVTALRPPRDRFVPTLAPQSADDAKVAVNAKLGAGRPDTERAVASHACPPPPAKSGSRGSAKPGLELSALSELAPETFRPEGAAVRDAAPALGRDHLLQA